MSLAKIHEVGKSQKDQGECGRCGVPLPKGSPYRWFTVGFRSSYKRVRCMKPECTPKQSERESSKLAEVYSALEAAEVDIENATEKDEIEQAVREFADAVRETGSEYSEASINPNTGSVFNPEAEERGEALTSWGDELDSFSVDEDEPDRDNYPEGDVGDAEYSEAFEEFLSNAKQQASEAINDMPL